MDITDFAVLGLFCMVGFVFSAFAYIKQFDIRIVQMEECLNELDEGGISGHTIRKQMKQQRTLFIVAVLLLITGFAVMALIMLL